MNESKALAPTARKVPEKIGQWGSPVINLEQVIPDTFFDIRAYLHILLKRRWTVFTVATVLVTGIVVYSFKMKPVFQATAHVVVEADTPHIQSLNDLDRSNPTDESFVETQAQILQGDNLAWRTIEQLNLGQNPAFFDASTFKAPKGAEPSTAMQSQLLKLFSNSLTVERDPNSQLIMVKVESTDPKLAAQIANALVRNYIEDNFRQKYDATRQTSGWMEQQMDELKGKVEKSQSALVEYERQNVIVNSGEKENVVEQRLADLSRDLTTAQSDRLQKESLYDSVKDNGDQVAFVAQNDLLQKLQEKSADLKAQYVDALGQYGPNFPKVSRLRDQVDEIQSFIDRERTRVVSQIHNEFQTAAGHEKLLASAVAEQKAEVGRLNQLLIQHNILKRDYDTNQQLYDNLLERLKDATVSAGLRATNLHFVDQAFTPAFPVRPKMLLNISLAILIGLVLGVTAAFLQEGLDTSVKSAEDIESLTNSPTLAVIPVGATNGNRRWWSRGVGKGASAKPSTVELTMQGENNSALAEAYRTLRTSVLLSTAPQPPQVVLVTSSQPNEGKTCTSLNLAFALSQRGPRVLIVDADMRKPGVSRKLGLESAKGLSSVLTGAFKVDDVLQQIEGTTNVWVIATGPRPPNPAELLSSQSMEELMGELRSRFDHIIVDSPPLLLVTDATIISRLVDGCVRREAACSGPIGLSRRLGRGSSVLP